MSLNAAVTALRDAAPFRRIDERRLKVIAMMGETLSFSPGERLFERGEPGDAAFVVIDGAVDVLLGAPGQETTIATLGKGEIFGEIAALCDQTRTTAIAARGALSVLRLEKSVLRNLIHEFPDLALEFLRVIASRLEATNVQLGEARQKLRQIEG
ncbi:cyclic nucleotide-binding domain-containing protein [Limibaculum sp. M0105]|uniref:Cyclic nucleotide-binding domain-containing protein n=1 Tax=Thermohalobaculum xanthum TaxID=2753746 RepID=A0A8J7M5L5_9RHOB|nr:cyclic nucleotide-binding domain-containing protein [Thermohalobaculum xanthum]MBK0398693.1 cyclic nucleotide-binding domain-containing protein [Thermohalobaculum xanthum]